MPLSPLTLSGRYVRLEPLASNHSAELRDAADLQSIWTFMPLDASGEGFDRWFEMSLSIQSKGTELIFAVCDVSSGRAIGSTRYMNIELAHKRLEIGHTWYAPAFHGTKTNPEAKLLLLQHGFEELHLNRIELKCDARNARSRAAILKLGAQFEGIFRKHMVLRDGSLRDTAWFSILDEDWAAVKQKLKMRLYSDTKLSA